MDVAVVKLMVVAQDRMMLALTPPEAALNQALTLALLQASTMETSPCLYHAGVVGNKMQLFVCSTVQVHHLFACLLGQWDICLTFVLKVV